MLLIASMAASQTFDTEDKPLKRGDTPVFSLRQRPQKKILSMEEELEQIRKCRYIRKTPLQRVDSGNIDLDISFLSAKTIDQNANLSAKTRLSSISESVDEDGESKAIEHETQETPQITKANTGRIVVRPRSPIQPFIVHDTQLKRDKLEPTLITEFNNKCSVEPKKKSKSILKRETKPVGKLDLLYKEVSRAARQADVDLNAAVRSIRDGQEQDKRFERLQRTDQSVRRWNYIGRLVRSGWLFGRRGRSLKLFEDRKRKRRMNEMNLAHLPISYKASVGTLREQQSSQITTIQKRLTNSRSLPPVQHNRSKSVKGNSSPRILPSRSKQMHRNVDRSRSLPAIHKPNFL